MTLGSGTCRLTILSVRQMYANLPATAVTVGSSPVLTSAGAELSRGVLGMLGRHLRLATQMPGDDGSILLGTLDSIKPLVSDPSLPTSIPPDGFLLKTTAAHGQPVLLVTGSNDRGVLLGTFALLRKMQLHHEIAHVNEERNSVRAHPVDERVGQSRRHASNAAMPAAPSSSRVAMYGQI